MLVIFLGLVSASILPTVTLLVNSMASSGRSVAAINDLDHEVQVAMDALFFLFGAVAIVVAALIALAIPTPWPVNMVPLISAEILPRLGQAIVALGTMTVTLRLGQIPAILRRALKIRRDIAIEEARRATLEKAPAASMARAAFKAHPEFGKSVSVDDIVQER